MFVDVGLMSDRKDDLKWAEGSSDNEPSREEVISAIEEFDGGKFIVVEDERPVMIFKDGLMGFWRFSAHVKENKISS